MEVIVKYIKVLLEKRKFRTPINEEVTSREEGICITLNTHLVTKNNVEVSLTPREYQILKVFLENKGVTLSRQEIINVVWGNPVEEIDERTIDLHIKNIRSKLDIVSLITVRGYGYKWNE